jgi:hypothetical protein
MAARAQRPRKTDCDPSTDFNLCASSANTRLRQLVALRVRTMCPRLRAASRASGFGRRYAPLDPVLVASVWQLRDAAHRDRLPIGS